MMLLPAALLGMVQATAVAPARDGAQCVGTPSELEPLINPSFVTRRYRIRNSCLGDQGKVAVILFCDGTGATMIYLRAGQEKMWSCYTSKDNGVGPGVLSIRTSWVR